MCVSKTGAVSILTSVPRSLTLARLACRQRKERARECPQTLEWLQKLESLVVFTLVVCANRHFGLVRWRLPVAYGIEVGGHYTMPIGAWLATFVSTMAVRPLAHGSWLANRRGIAGGRYNGLYSPLTVPFCFKSWGYDVLNRRLRFSFRKVPEVLVERACQGPNRGLESGCGRDVEDGRREVC